MTNRLSEWLSTIPFATRCFLFLNVFITILQFTLNFNVSRYYLCTFPVLYLYEFQRLLTSSFLHGGAIHLLMNMMTFISLGPRIERTLGSLIFIFYIIEFAILNGILYVLMYYVYYLLSHQLNVLVQCAIGFSAVLFSLVVIDTLNSSQETRSIFGFFNVPSYLYPWVLLIILQLLLPNISFVGHLAGILIGFLYIQGFLTWILIPSSLIRYIEDISIIRPYTFNASYIRCPDSVFSSSSCFATLSNLISGTWNNATNIISPTQYFTGIGQTTGYRNQEGYQIVSTEDKLSNEPVIESNKSSTIPNSQINKVQNETGKPGKDISIEINQDDDEVVNNIIQQSFEEEMKKAIQQSLHENY